jgi:hypothetical protein
MVAPDRRSWQFRKIWRNAGARAILVGKSLKRFAKARRRVETMDEKAQEHSGWSWWYLLLIVQFAAVLWPPFYNSVEPAWAGIPFFYWYQMLWVIIAAVLTAIVYFATEKN